MSRARLIGRGVVLLLLMAAVGCGDGPDTSSADRAAPSDSAPTTSDSITAGPSDSASRLEDDYRQTFTEASPADRVAAAFRVMEDEAVDPRVKGTLVAEALQRELDEPSASGAPTTTYLSATDWVRAGMTRAMARLARLDPEQVARRQDGASGELWDRLAIARGYAGDRAVVSDLRRVLVESEHGDVRTDAAYLLGELGDALAVPELTRALEDPYEASWEEEGVPVRFRTVCVQAATALAKVGVDAEPCPP